MKEVGETNRWFIYWSISLSVLCFLFVELNWNVFFFIYWRFFNSVISFLFFREKCDFNWIFFFGLRGQIHKLCQMKLMVDRLIKARKLRLITMNLIDEPNQFTWHNLWIDFVIFCLYLNHFVLFFFFLIPRTWTRYQHNPIVTHWSRNGPSKEFYSYR